MFNKIMMYLFLIVGTIASTYIGFYLFFIEGLKIILTSCVIENAKLVPNEWALIVGSLKIISAGFVFWFVLGFFLSTAKSFSEKCNE